MKILVPEIINHADMTTNVTDSTPAWTEQPYEKGVRVRVGLEVWQANIKTNDIPPSDGNVQWTKVGVINSARLIDDKISTQTESNNAFASGTGNGIQFEYRPNNIVDGVALFNVQAETLHIEVIDDADGIVYDELIDLVDDSHIYDPWTYFTAPIRHKKDVVVLDLPPYAGALIRISLTAVDNSAKCGSLVLGQQQWIGDTLWGSSPDYKDFSRVKTDDWGNYEWSRGLSAKRLKVPVMIPADIADFVHSLLDEARGNPHVFIANERRASGLIRGFLRRVDIVQSNPNFDDLTLNIEGLT